MAQGDCFRCYRIQDGCDNVLTSLNSVSREKSERLVRGMLPEKLELKEQISSTANAQVWKAFDTELGKLIAVKNAPEDSKTRKRFHREIHALQAAQGYHVIPLLDHDDTYSWYTMPLAEHTLFDRKIADGFIEGMAVLKAIAEALRPIHQRQQVHRDLKPQNILWLNEGGDERWVVADFGIVRNPAGETTSQFTRDGGLLGTQGWAAPEQYKTAHDVSPQTDVFSAGVILGWMLTGITPTPLQIPLPEGPPEVRGILMRATHGNARHRHSSIDDLLRDLGEISDPQTVALGTLVRRLDFSGLTARILGDPSKVYESVMVMPSLKRGATRKWQRENSEGLLKTVSFVLEELRVDLHGLPYGDIDRFLSWCVDVLEVLLKGKERIDAERFATLLFSAIADVHQFAPAKDLLDFLETLGDTDQDIMRAALYSSTGREFFRGQASGRYITNSTSDLVRELSGR